MAEILLNKILNGYLLFIDSKNGDAMPAIQSLASLLGINLRTFSKKETLLLEAELLRRIGHELKDIFRSQYKSYFNLMKFTFEMEEDMLDTNFSRLLILEMLSSDEYTLEGIAHYTHTPLDIIQEIVMQKCSSISYPFFQRLIELHCSINREVYENIMQKIAQEYSNKQNQVCLRNNIS